MSIHDYKIDITNIIHLKTYHQESFPFSYVKHLPVVVPNSSCKISKELVGML